MGELIAVLFRFLIFLFLFAVVRSFLRSLFAGFRSTAVPPQPTRQPPPTIDAGGVLKKDPVCGTYVSPAVSLSRTVKGRTLYFCSPECRDRYQPQ